MPMLGIVEQYPYAAVFFLLILGALGLPFPEDLTLVLCGFLIANNLVKPLPVLLLVFGIMVSIDVVFFFLGRKYGPDIVNHERFRKIMSKERLEQLESKFNKWGLLFVLLGRQVVVLRTQLLLATGIFRMPRAKFLAADIISVPVTMMIMVGMGYLGGNSLQVVEKDVTKIEHITIIGLVVVALIFILYRYVKYLLR